MAKSKVKLAEQNADRLLAAIRAIKDEIKGFQRFSSDELWTAINKLDDIAYKNVRKRLPWY